MGYYKYRKKRFFYPGLEGLPYKKIAIKEPVYEEFRKLADDTKSEHTRLLMELIKMYKKHANSSEDPLHQYF